MVDDHSEDTLVTSGSGKASPKATPKSLSKSKSRSRSKSRSKSKSKSRCKSRGKSSKSPGKSKMRSKSKSRKQKRENFGWWDLENDPELIAALEAEGLREKARIAEDEALLKRRQEIVRKYMQQHIDEMEAEEEERRAAAAASRTRGVAQRFLQQVQQKERESKPIVLNSVRAAPLKIDVSKWEAPKYKKDADEKALIKQTAKKHFLFKDRKDYVKELSTTRSQKSNLNCGIASNTVAMMIKAFEPVNVDKGNAIIQQGKLDQHLYVIDQGKVEFQVDDATVATGSAGTTFGDQNLLHVVPAQKTVIATESTKVFRLHQETYRGILQQRHIVENGKRKQKEKERLEKEQSKEKEEEEKATAEAKTEVSKDFKSVEEEEKEVEIPKEKETKKKKKKTKKAEEKKLEEEEEKEEEEWWRDEKNAQLQIAIRDALARVHQDELERIKVLGEGQFGEVWLVAANLDVEEQEESQRYEFALKLQETYDEYREETAAHEIKIMKEVSGYPFVSMLYRSYETEESKDMLLGLIPGGELWDTIHQEDEETGEWLSGLSEGQSRFYALLVADTLDYLHSKHYVFRDLKPENIMLDGWGYPIIVDFGFCKLLPKGPTDKTFTFCGTPNYISPEIVLNVGHNGAADCWALGIVIYEMISGINPFYWDDMDQVELYRSICEDAGEPLDEKHHSRQVRRLVDSLLTKDPDKRMKAKDILKHGWFEGLSLEMMRKRQVQAPWIPPGGEGENAEYICDYNEDATKATAAHRKREQEIEEELNRMKKEEERRLKREEEELERLSLLAEEQQRRDEEERLREEQERRLQEELEKQQRLEEEERVREEDEQRKREEEEEMRQRIELEEQRLREEEEERLRIEKEDLLRKEEEERLRIEADERLRIEEEERLRVEEELRLRREEEERVLREEEELRQRMEEERRLREEEEERLRQEEEERLSQEEEELQRKKELKRQKVLEEQRQREEEEERQRQKELRRQRMLAEHRQRKEEEKRQKMLKEEEERLQRELEEEQRRLDEEEERQREITRRRRMEMEELEKEIEEKEQEDQQRRLDEEEERQREVALRRRVELEAEMQRHERKIEKEEQALFKRRKGSNNFHDGDYFVNKVQSWEQSPVPQPQRSFRSSMEDSPVPKGYVSKIIKDTTEKSPRIKPPQSPGALDVRKSVKKGIVAKRLSAAKLNEDPANIPSLFASFSILEKSKKK